MRILVIGSGAREHAIAWKFSQSNRNTGLFVAPGNAGSEQFATNVPDIDGKDSKKVIDFCQSNQIDIVFVGPEEPLSMGLVDDLEEAGIQAIGPRKTAAQLEASKAFSKNFMAKYGIPTAKADIVEDGRALKKLISKRKGKVVVKKSGLAAGKGVLESDDSNELETFGKEGLKDGPLVVEEYLSGYEISVFALSDGKSYKLLPPCTDYKKSGDDNTGSNTGGMGAICPVPWVDSALMTSIEQDIVKPTFEGFREEEFDYRGVVYFGLMITQDGPKLLEYNARFGDPEAQVLLPLIESDFCNLAEAIVEQRLDELELAISDKTAVCVVIASPGYPGPYKKNLLVTLAKDSPTQLIFHANTHSKDQKVYTGGGRCFSVIGLGSEIFSARTQAYALASGVQFNGAWYRKDIGNRVYAV